MTDQTSTPFPDRTKATEVKTKLASLAAFVVSGAVINILQGLDLTGLPQWAAGIAGPAVVGAITWLVGYNASHQPRKLSASALQALARR